MYRSSSGLSQTSCDCFILAAVMTLLQNYTAAFNHRGDRFCPFIQNTHNEETQIATYSFETLSNNKKIFSESFKKH